MRFNKLVSSTALLTIITLAACGGADTRTRGSTAITDTTPILDVANLDRQDLDLVPLTAEDRFIKLETEVTSLRQEMAQMKQAFANIAALETNIQGLLTELRGLRLDAPAPNTAAITSPEMPPQQQAQDAPLSITKKMQPIVEPAKPAKSKKQTAKPVAQQDGITNIRIGADQNRTRVVFDINGKVDYSSDFDTEENLLMVSFKNLKAANNIRPETLRGGNITSAAISEDNGETIVAFSLKPGSTMKAQDIIQPSAAAPYTRLFFDFN